jgi:hypothetical protein
VRGELVVHWDDDDWSAPSRFATRSKPPPLDPHPTFCYRRRFWEGAPFLDTSFGRDTGYLWQDPPKRVGALPDSSFYVALVHAGNTSHKKVHDACWHPRPVEEITSFMGPEWAAHWAADQIAGAGQGAAVVLSGPHRGWRSSCDA